jgi:hypothetical protein
LPDGWNAARDLDRAKLRAVRVPSKDVDSAVADSTITEAQVFVIAVGPRPGTVIDAAAVIYHKSGRPRGSIVPIQLPRAVLKSASVLRERTGSEVFDLRKEETFDEDVERLAATLRARINPSRGQGTVTPRKPRTEADGTNLPRGKGTVTPRKGRQWPSESP